MEDKSTRQTAARDEAREKVEMLSDEEQGARRRRRQEHPFLHPQSLVGTGVPVAGEEHDLG